MKRLPLGLLIVGLVTLLCAPLLGLAGTVFAMVGAFDTLGATGISDPKALAGHIGTVLMSTMVGLIISGTIGAPIAIVGLVLHFAARKPAGSQIEHPTG
jgi:biopolymer transport protein ExbB/TolQ